MPVHKDSNGNSELNAKPKQLKPKEENANNCDGLIEKPKANHVVAEEEEEADDEIDQTAAAVVVPTDSGWAWVVMVASFLCCTVIDGVVFCSPLIQDSLMKEFDSSKAYTSLVSSLLSGCYLLAGPFVSALANKFGFRPVAMTGSALAAICFVASKYAPSVEFLFLFYGIIGGFGFCMVYIPAVVIIGFYFEKWRALATGMALCGSGVGTFIFAPLTNALLASYGWRLTLAIQGGIILLCAVFALTFRPIQPITLEVTDDDDDEHGASKSTAIAANAEANSKCNGHGHGNTVAPKPELLQPAFTKPLPEGRFAYSMPNSAQSTYMGHAPKHQYPAASDIFKNVSLERRSSASGNKGTELKLMRKSQPTTPNGVDTQAQQHQMLVHHLHQELATVGENEEETENETLLGDDGKQIVIQARRHTVSGRRPIDLAKRKEATTGHGPQHSQVLAHPNGTVNARPMYRDDVFFTGSLTRIPQYQSQSSLGYHMSVTRLPTKHDMLEERRRECHLCPEAVRRILSTMLDVSLLKSWSFMLLAFSGFLTMMGFFVPFAFLTDRAQAAGMSNASAMSVLSGIGLVNTVARIGCGLMSSYPSVKPLLLNNIALTAGGLATIFSGVVVNEASQWCFAVLFGICIACFSALRSLIAVEMIGLDKLTNAFGILMLFQGIAATVGSPIAGFLYDQTKSYDVSFYFAGILILLSAFLCYPLNYVSSWEKARNEAAEAKKQTQAVA